MTLDEWKSLSEIARNLVQVLGFGGALFLLYQWIYSRRDRATDVLLQLDDQFTTDEMVNGRRLVEDDEEWRRVRLVLTRAVAPEEAQGAGDQAARAAMADSDAEIVRVIDKLLRFYVLLCGVREARQVSDLALRTCFRYWLAQYYNPSRRELRLYIDTFYPTLSAWLKADRRLFKRLFRLSFFGPEGFGWRPERRPVQQEIQRALLGRVLVITGAGISADSGVPTYRGKGGYWQNLNAKTLATRAAFDRDAGRIWEWYGERRSLIRSAAPNAAHVALASLTARAQEVLVITQNVDDLHERAGLRPDRLVHIHGQIFDNRCTKCDYSSAEPVKAEPIPLCPRCAAPLRPGVVWFDEELCQEEVARIDGFIARGPCDVVLVIGTDVAFDYILSWALRAVAPGGLLIEINPETTRLSSAANLSIRKRAAASVPALIGDPATANG
jgi:NAD-dependent deacetylase